MVMASTMLVRRGITSAVVPVALWTLACSAASGQTGSNSSTSNGGVTSSSDSGAATGAGGTDTSGSGGIGGLLSGSGGSAGSTTSLDGGCYAESSAAEQVVTNSPVDMLIMYDQSGSMGDDTPVGTKWDAIKAAVIGFVNSPNSVGIGVGIDYFPQILPGAPTNCTTDADCVTAAGDFGTCQGLNIIIACFCACSLADNCQVPAYSTPEVGIDVLPGVAPAIINSLNAHGPQGNTPTRPALEGAQAYAHDWATAHPDRKTVVVLATDGDPTQCTQNSVQDVANIAAAGLANTPSVKTFVIGVGSSLTSLNSIAAAGGTGQALIVDTASGDPTQQFLDALNQIRQVISVSAPVPCEWVIPPPPAGQTFDTSKVNVQFSSGATAPQPIGAVLTEADCANVSGGWYFDDRNNPTKVMVCPQTCDTIQAVADARVDVVFGCATEFAIR